MDKRYEVHTRSVYLGEDLIERLEGLAVPEESVRRVRSGSKKAPKGSVSKVIRTICARYFQLVDGQLDAEAVRQLNAIDVQAVKAALLRFTRAAAPSEKRRRKTKKVA